MDKDQRAYAFQLGWSQVKNCDIKDARKDLMRALGITSNVSFLNRMNGKVEPKISEAKGIERVFAKYGIKSIWGRAQ